MKPLNFAVFDDSIHTHNTAAAARRMWTAVVFQGLLDATYTGPDWERIKLQRTAHDWITFAGSNFHFACALAGMDADFIADYYKAGKIDGKALRKAVYFDDEEPSRELKRVMPGKIVSTILGAMQGEMKTSEIRRAIADQGLHLTSKQVRNNLSGALQKTGKVKGRMVGNLMYWTKVDEK